MTIDVPLKNVKAMYGAFRRYGSTDEGEGSRLKCRLKEPFINMSKP